MDAKSPRSLRNASMAKISRDGRWSKYATISVFICVGFCVAKLAGFLLSTWQGVAIVLCLSAVGVVICTTIFPFADSVLESADGTFLRVKINRTETVLPLSAIESCVIVYLKGPDALRIAVKHQFSSKGFLLGGTVFLFLPNGRYFQSALLRCFPIRDDDLARLRRQMKFL